MKTKFKINSLIKNKNFGNNQNYIFGRKEKYILFSFFYEEYNQKTKKDSGKDSFIIFFLLLFAGLTSSISILFFSGYLGILIAVFFMLFTIYLIINIHRDSIYDSVKNYSFFKLNPFNSYEHIDDKDFIYSGGKVLKENYIFFKKDIDEYLEFEKLDF